jgi:DNA-binding XRE family transcriptional regulator
LSDNLQLPARAGLHPESAAKMPRDFPFVKLKLYFFFSLVYISTMITSAQIRAARGLLKWTQTMLAHKASISPVTLNMIESDNVDPRASTLRAIETVLEKAGIELIGNEQEGFGVRLRPSRRR